MAPLDTQRLHHLRIYNKKKIRNLLYCKVIDYVDGKVCCAGSRIPRSQAAKVQLMFSRRERLQENPVPVAY